MIGALSIENFALIDSVRIDFKSGFTVITGETGSGKSILLNALNLILGERANFNVIGGRSDKSIVEAEINIKGFNLESFFKKNELDYFETTIIRREIHKQGRSRAFINDTPVQLTVLKQFSSQLIHIHSQYNTLDLKNADYQLEVLDVLAGVMTAREKYNKAFNQYKALQKQLNEKRTLLNDSIAQEDYNAFQLNELKTLQLDRLNYEEVEAEAKKGEHADDIRMALGETVSTLSDERGVLDLLNTLKSSLSKRVGLDTLVDSLLERINGASIELEDIVSEAESAMENVDFDPQKLDKIVALLDSYNRVMQKHGTTTQSELMAFMDQLSASSENHQVLEEEIVQLEAKLKDGLEKLEKQAQILHEKRLKAIPGIEKALQNSLAELKLENTVFQFKLETSEALSNYGNSSLEMLFSPNVGIDPVPVHQAASGGELSRVMLALQSLMSSKVKLHTILFDEIDTGVSGDVAQKMGSTLKNMGDGMQVIAITHLPQVAAKGGQHFKVLKSLEGDRTVTRVYELSDQERVEETARLMSGDEINSAALENAKALMQ